MDRIRAKAEFNKQIATRDAQIAELRERVAVLKGKLERALKEVVRLQEGPDEANELRSALELLKNNDGCWCDASAEDHAHTETCRKVQGIAEKGGEDSTTP